MENRKEEGNNNQPENLVSWLVGFGGSLSPSLFLRHEEDDRAGGTDSGLSLMVKEGTSVAAGESVMRVPMEACMTVKIAYSSLSDTLSKEKVLDDDELLALHLMVERNKADDSSWAHFVKSLPLSFDTPLYWTDEQLGWLGPSVSRLLTQMLKARIERDWEDIHLPLVREYPNLLGGLTLEDYRWALSCVWSRAIGYYDSQNRYYKCLVPVLSAANHDTSAASFLSDIVSLDGGESSIGDDKGREIWDIRAGRDYAGPCEFFILYGPYTNTKLLYTYGFVLPDNPLKGVDWWMRVPKGDSLKSELLSGIAQTYDFDGTLRLQLHIDGEGAAYEADERSVEVEATASVTLPLMRTIRIMLATPEELSVAVLTVGPKNVGNAMISPRNESACYASLLSQFRAKVGQYNIALASLTDAVRNSLVSYPPISMTPRTTMVFPVFITSTLSPAVISASDEKNTVEGRNQGKNWKRMGASARRIHCATTVLRDEQSVFQAVITMLERAYIELKESVDPSLFTPPPGVGTGVGTY